MSTGGTKSVLHNDDLDNINCLLRGKKELLFINPDKYGDKVHILSLIWKFLYSPKYLDLRLSPII